MAWFTPTLALCRTRITDPEWRSLSSAAKASGQVAEDMAQEVIATLVNEIRGRVPKHVMRGEAGTIPDEVKRAFLALWVFDFITRVPGMKALADELRVKAYDDANRNLRELSAGSIDIVPPETAAPDEQQAGSNGVEIVSSRPNEASPCKMNGLL